MKTLYQKNGLGNSKPSALSVIIQHMIEAPRTYLERVKPGPLEEENPGIRPFLEAVRTDYVWNDLRQNPPSLIAVLNDGVQYVIFEEEQKASLEISDTGWDRVLAATDIHKDHLQARILTLSTSLDNITGFSDAAAYEVSLIGTYEIELGPTTFAFIRPSSFDTFTELIEVADEALRFDHQNIAVITNRKQAERAQVLLDTLRFADDPREWKRMNHYFKEYMPSRLRTIWDPRISKVLPRYQTLAYEKILPQAEKLRAKRFQIIASEDITGTNLDNGQDHDSNLRGVREWLEGTYGQGFINGTLSSDDILPFRIVKSTDPTDIPRSGPIKVGMARGLD